MKIKILVLGLICLYLIFFSYCKKTPTTPNLPTEKNPPIINSFSADPEEIFRGGSSTLSWKVSNATTIEIDNGIGKVNAEDEKEVSPEETTTYTLTATNADGTTTKKCKVTVKLNLPKIEEFKTTPSTINYGDSAEMYWYVSNADKVEIDQGIGEVPATGPEENVIAGTKEVSPTETTTYILTATNKDGETEKSCTLIVKSAANVIMTEGPKWKEDEWTFSYFGIVKNIGNKEASYVKVYIYLYDSSGDLIDYDYTYVDKIHLDPDESSPWEESWWDDDKAIRKKINKSKTKYEIEWSEYDSLGNKKIFKTGRISF